MTFSDRLKPLRNYKNNLKADYVFVLLLIVSFSCELVIDVDIPDFEPALVVNGFLVEGDTLFVEVTENISILKAEFNQKNINDAQIVLKQAGAEIARLSNINNLGLYSSHFIPEKGVEYEITVSHPNYETAIAKETIPVQYANVTEITWDKIGYDQKQMTLTISDGPEDNYYQLFAYTYDYQFNFNEDGSKVIEIDTFTNKVYMYSENLIFDDYSGYDGVLIFSDELFNGRTQQLSFEYHNSGQQLYYGQLEFEEPLIFEADTSVYVEIRAVSNDYYSYFRTRAIQSYNSGNVFSEPVQVFNNIQNGYGIFAGYNKRTFKQ